MARRKISKSARLADAVGFSHFLIANVLIILGETTAIFANLGAKHGGVAFVLQYVDAPIYAMIAPFVGFSRYDAAHTFFFAETVVVTSSFVYGFIVYAICRLIGALTV